MFMSILPAQRGKGDCIAGLLLLSSLTLLPKCDFVSPITHEKRNNDRFRKMAGTEVAQ
jgi:hypothetical protein